MLSLILIITAAGVPYVLIGMLYALWLLNHGEKAFKGFYVFVISLWSFIIVGQIVCSLLDWADALFGGTVAKLDRLLGKLTHGLVPAGKNANDHD